MSASIRRRGGCGSALAIAAIMTPVAATAQGGAPVVFAPGGGNPAGIDYAGAQPLPLPMATTAPPSLRDVLLGPSPPSATAESQGISPGRAGDGRRSEEVLAPAKALDTVGAGGVQPSEFGSSGQPYSTSRVNARGDVTVRHFPYSAAGKLFFNVGASTFLCSGALIKPGIVVTAAHCVANFGSGQFYTNWRFVPAYNDGVAPYGTWTARSASVLPAYLNGSDPCAAKGVICRDDVAVITLNPQKGAYPGARTGWLGYTWGGYSYNAEGRVQIAQLGYPAALDAGALQQRTDSQGYQAPEFSDNTIIGSLQTGGSSGGPWVVNLGVAPSLAGTTFGTDADHNTVVGVTSWGYVDGAVKQQGASPFTAANIQSLVSAACAATPAACS